MGKRQSETDDICFNFSTAPNLKHIKLIWAQNHLWRYCRSVQQRNWPEIEDGFRTHPAASIHKLIDGCVDVVSFPVVLIILSGSTGQQGSVTSHEFVKLVLILSPLLILCRFVFPRGCLCLSEVQSLLVSGTTMYADTAQ